MQTLPRLKPHPLPAIHPLPEHAATGDRRAVYQATKAALGVPWMGVVTMAFSHYPSFYASLWSGIEPLCDSAEFQTACRQLRSFTEARAAALDHPDHGDLGQRLRSAGYSERELDDIRATLEVFSVGNMPYVLIATVARLLLTGGALSTAPATPGARPVPAVASLVLMEPHHADGPTMALYDDIRATLGLPFVNTDYRALARWPSYFAAAWADLKPGIVAPGYEPLVESVHDEAVRLVRALPNPGALHPDALKAAARDDGAPDGVVEGTVQLFQWLLPGLVLNVAGLRRQLSPGF